MVGEESEATRKRGVGHRFSLRRQDSAHTGRYGDTLILPTSARRHLRRASAALIIRSRTVHKGPAAEDVLRHSHVVGGESGHSTVNALQEGASLCSTTRCRV